MTSRTDRRAFLKTMGVSAGGVFVGLSGCDLTSPSLEEGVETVTSYMDPQDWVIPGKEIWYATTCTQCPANCGIHARVREGLVRKLEGNPDSPINAGRLCAAGQAGLQHHFSPDRLQKPLARERGQLVEIAWDDARTRLQQAVARATERKGGGFALLTGELSGHGAVLAKSFVASLGGGARHFAFEPISTASARRANEQIAGIAMPQLDFDKARLILAIGADFLGTWRSPVHWSMQYAQFRKAPRGALVVVEPKMSLTGGNADWWRPIRAGGEGWLMLGLAKLLVERDDSIAARLPDPAMRGALARYELKAVAQQTDIAPDQIERLAAALLKRRPSLVLVGGPAESGEQGQRHVEAGWLLNHLLGNVGQTVLAPAIVAHAELEAMPGSTAALREFVDALPQLDTVLVWGANPVYHAPQGLSVREKLAKVAQRIAFASELDETAALADLVIPVRSPLEEWGTHVPQTNPKPGLVHVQQPVMQPLYADVPAASDLLLAMLAQAGADVATDHYAWLRDAVQKLRGEAERIGPAPYKLPKLLDPPVFAPATPGDAFSGDELDRAFWEATVARGLLQLPTRPASPLQPKVRVPELAPTVADAKDGSFALIVSPRTGLFDGRHANLPWLQELPDPLTTVVWDSWAEVHPETAGKLGLAQGDIVELTSPHGRLQVKTVIFPGIHPEAIAVPLGQGHNVGRYAKGIGANPLAILAPVFDRDSGELALCGTRVKAKRIGRDDPLVRMAPTEYQNQRRIVRTVSARRFDATEKA